MATATPVSDYVSLTALMDTGKVRDHNEDNFIVCPDLSKNNWYVDEKPVPLSPQGCLLVVADGMGGANAGEVASEISVESIKHFFSSLLLSKQPSEKQAKEYLAQAIYLAHEAIVAHARSHPQCEGMGTTIILAWVLNSKVILAWCGDSRAYLYRPNEGLRMLTRDHSLVWELVEAGQLSADEADFHPKSNFITQNLGNPGNPPQPDLAVVSLQAFDRLLLCSDGLNNMLTSAAIEKIISQPKNLVETSKELVESANGNGGKDNITVVLLEVAEGFHSAQRKLPGLRKRLLVAGIALGALLMLALSWWTGNQVRKDKPLARMTERKPDSLQEPPAISPNTLVKDESSDLEQAPEAKQNQTERNEPSANGNMAKVRPAPLDADARWDTSLNRIVAIVAQRDQLVLPKVSSAQEVVKDTLTAYFEGSGTETDTMASSLIPKESYLLLAQLDTIIARRNFREWAKNWSNSSQKENIRKQVKSQWSTLKALEGELTEAEEILAGISNSGM